MTKILTLVIAAGMFSSAVGAELYGKMTFKGQQPPEVPIPLDANCSKVQHEKITTRHYLVAPDGGLANVFVWIKEGVTGKYPPPKKEAILDQHGCEYLPYVQGIQVGQPLKILNSDPFLHNVNCLPKENKGFNLAQVVKGQSTVKTFDKQEVLVKFKCDVHPWMFAYVGVVNHPFFAVTDKEGKFKIPHVPAGTYAVEAYHLKCGKQTAKITVGADDRKEIDFTFQAPVRK